MATAVTDRRGRGRRSAAEVTSWIGGAVIGAVLGQLLVACSATSDRIHIGALFEPGFESQRRAFQWAVRAVNQDPGTARRVLLEARMETVEPEDSIMAQREACGMVSGGVAAILGPLTPCSASHVSLLCDALEMPHVLWRGAPHNRDYFTVALQPDAPVLTRAYGDVIRRLGWERLTVLYEDDVGLSQLLSVLTSEVSVQRLERAVGQPAGLLSELKERGTTHFLVHSGLDMANRVLQAVAKAGMTSDDFHYFFTTLDLGLAVMANVSEGGAHVNGLRLLSPDSPLVTRTLQEWRQAGDNSPLMDQRGIQTDQALLYDAVRLVWMALGEMSASMDVRTQSQDCCNPVSWRQGNALLNYMKVMDFEGLTGRVRFNDSRRTDFSLDVMRLTKAGLKKQGQWDGLRGLNMTVTNSGPGMGVAGLTLLFLGLMGYAVLVLH